MEAALRFACRRHYFLFEDKNRGKRDLSQKCFVSEQFSPSCPWPQMIRVLQHTTINVNLPFDVLNPCVPVLVRTSKPCYRLSHSFPPVAISACRSTCMVTSRWVRYPNSSSTIQIRRIMLWLRAGTPRSRHIDWSSYRRLFALVQWRRYWLSRVGASRR